MKSYLEQNMQKPKMATHGDTEGLEVPGNRRLHAAESEAAERLKRTMNTSAVAERPGTAASGPAIFPKGASEEVRVWAEPYKGNPFIHARIFWDPGDGERKPTKKGLTLSPELAGEVGVAILRAAGFTTAEEIAQAMASANFLKDAGAEGRQA